jgi:zinc protease
MEMLDEGTATMDALEISDELLRLGAQLTSGANLDFSVVGLSALKENLDESLAIYADVILNPAFAPAELERLKALQLAGIQQEKNSPEDMALRVLPRLLYGEGHAYSLPMTGSGTEEAVAALGRDDLVAYHGSWFKPNNATLIVVGDTTLAEVRPKLEALFARWRPGNVPAKTLPAVAPPERPSVYLIDRPGSEQSVIIAGHLIGKRDPADDIAVDAMNDILGGAFTSRVNMNLREDKGWSYGADTVIVDTQAQRPFLAIAPVQADRTAASMQEIKRRSRVRRSAQPLTPRSQRASGAARRRCPRWETALRRPRHRGARALRSARRLLERLRRARRRPRRRGSSRCRGAYPLAGAADLGGRRRSRRHRGGSAGACARRDPHRGRGRQSGRPSMNVR